MLLRIATSFASVTLLASLGCTRILPPLTAPEDGGPQWREMVSKHVILRTDRDEGDAREALTELEHTYAALHDIAFPQVNVDGSRIVVVHFNRERDYNQFSPAQTSGQFYWKLPNDLEAEPTMLVWGKLDASARATLQHELTHMFVRASLGGAPPWLNEGLAQYYETLEVSDGFAYVGRPLRKARAWPKTEWGQERSGVFMTATVPIGALPRVKDLVEMSSSQFYVWSDKGRQPTLDEGRAGTANYLGAYGLVHMILHEPEYQAKFDAMMELVSRGVPIRNAWQGSFDDVSTDELESDYRRHLLNRYETMVLKTPYALAPVAAELDRAMAPADVHVLWARLRPWGAAELALAREEIQRARALASTSAEVLFWSGRMRAAEGDAAGAQADLDAAVATKPKEPRYLEGLAVLYRRLRANDQADKDLAMKEQAAIARLAIVAVSGTELDTLADYHERSGHLDEALGYAQRAVKADPTCWTCFRSLGEILFQKKQFADAARVQTIALSLLPDGAQQPGEEAKLRTYLEAARTAPVVPATPPAATPPAQAPPEAPPAPDPKK